MALADMFKNLRRGRKPVEPVRDTRAYPNLLQIGRYTPQKRLQFKPTPRNLRYFGRTVYGRRALNAIKNPIAGLDWEIVPLPDVKESSELKRQIEAATLCFEQPNNDDSFRTLTEQAIEDYLHGAGAIELQTSGNMIRPLWMYPVDGLSIQINSAWSGDDAEARYAQSVGYASYTGGGPEILLRNDELIYIRPNPSTATPFGLGPLEVAFTSISRILGVGDYAGLVSSNKAPGMMINVGKTATDDKLAAFRSYWTNEVEGQGKTPVIGGDGAEILKLYPDGDAALYLEYQDFLKSEIAVAFDLSPMNLGVERDVNRNTAEVMEDRDWDQAIIPHALNYAEYLTREALWRKLGFWQLQFRFKGLDRKDEKASADIYASDYKNNATVPNERRVALGLPPLDNQWADMTYADLQVAIAAAKQQQSAAPEDEGADNEPPETKPAKGKKPKD